MESDRSKFGHIVDGEDIDFAYPDLWAKEKTTGPARLVVAPSCNHVSVLIELLSAMPGPFWILYLLIVPRSEAKPGRYQAPEPMNADDVKAFLMRFRDTLEGDGRHNLWIASSVSADMLVYDRHNVIYAYGELEAFRFVLGSLHLCAVELIAFPVPHAHRYNERFDRDADQVLQYCQWVYSPLHEADE